MLAGQALVRTAARLQCRDHGSDSQRSRAGRSSPHPIGRKPQVQPPGHRSWNGKRRALHHHERPALANSRVFAGDTWGLCNARLTDADPRNNRAHRASQDAPLHAHTYLTLDSDGGGQILNGEALLGQWQSPAPTPRGSLRSSSSLANAPGRSVCGWRLAGREGDRLGWQYAGGTDGTEAGTATGGPKKSKKSKRPKTPREAD